MVLSDDAWLRLTAVGSAGYAAAGTCAPRQMIKTFYEPGTPELLPPLRYFGVAAAGITAQALTLVNDKECTEKTKKQFLKINAGMWLAAGALTTYHGYTGQHKKSTAYGVGGTTAGIGALMMFDACKGKKKSCCGGSSKIPTPEARK
ncbi:hypothetical protein FOA52_005881 [Chlamydomonas sp. UWO 241]|nr:hypothetical protein FOA52_005881 [Chlamydomonas sp. UWO 241]